MHRVCFLNAFTWDTAIAYKNMHECVWQDQQWEIVELDGARMPSRHSIKKCVINVLFLCYQSLKQNHFLQSYNHEKYWRKYYRFDFKWLQILLGFTRWTLMMCNMWTRAGYFLCFVYLWKTSSFMKKRFPQVHDLCSTKTLPPQKIL